MATFTIEVPDALGARIGELLLRRYPQLAPLPPEQIGEQGFVLLIRELLEGVERARVEDEIRVLSDQHREKGYAAIAAMLAQLA